MCSPDRAHKIDDRHDHDAWSHDLHAERYLSAALRSDDAGTSRHDDEEERAPGFREKAPPFIGGIQKIGRRPSVHQKVLWRRSRCEPDGTRGCYAFFPHSISQIDDLTQ